MFTRRRRRRQRRCHITHESHRFTTFVLAFFVFCFFSSTPIFRGEIETVRRNPRLCNIWNNIYTTHDTQFLTHSRSFGFTVHESVKRKFNVIIFALPFSPLLSTQNKIRSAYLMWGARWQRHGARWAWSWDTSDSCVRLGLLIGSSSVPHRFLVGFRSFLMRKKK